ncbi:MAG: hypothetical protein HDS59_07820 [Barnesiella sp.]|nr:hypothetical protein [Barnesiella sp.]
MRAIDDNKFKWLMIALSALAMIFAACGSKNGDAHSKTSKVGKYIYKDAQEINHIDSDCSSLMRQGKYGNRDLYGKEMIDTSTFIIEEKFIVCVKCVGDNEYDHILGISQRNWHNRNRRRLYDKC